MTYLTAMLPMPAGVAAYGALHHAAAAAKAAGDPRGRGQLMADLLAHRITTGGAIAAADPAEIADTGRSLPAGANIEIQLVMTDRTLMDRDDGPVLINGYGIPAPMARRLLVGGGEGAGVGAPAVRRADDGRADQLRQAPPAGPGIDPHLLAGAGSGLPDPVVRRADPPLRPHRPRRRRRPDQPRERPGPVPELQPGQGAGGLVAHLAARWSHRDDDADRFRYLAIRRRCRDPDPARRAADVVWLSASG